MDVKSKLKGLVIHFEQDRIDLLSQFEKYQFELPNVYSEFSEPTKDFSYSRNLPLTCFLINKSGYIFAVALGKRGISAGTALRKVNLRDVTFLKNPLSFDDVGTNVPRRLYRGVISVFKNSGLFTHKGFFAVIDSLVRLAPELESTFEKYSLHKYERIRSLTSNQRSALARQKEALNTALMIGGFERDEIQNWQPPEEADGPISFLDGLPQCRLREDQMIINDLGIFPEMKKIKETVFSSAIFEGKNKKLTVILANRLPLEEETGTDLIYYNETFNSFVLIQYKVLEKSGNEVVFRYPNQKLSEEIQRMDEVLTKLSTIKKAANPNNFRLNDNPFFLKFCSRELLNPDDSALIPGMYLPLEFWKEIESSENYKGPGGGKLISYKNIGRYMDNTEFANMVSKAWIGTHIEQSKILEEIIKEIIQHGKSAMLAIKSMKKENKES